MRKRGSHLLTAGDDVRAEPIVTYTRLTPEEKSSAGGGRVEPHFTAVRIDGRGRPPGAQRDDELNDLPLVDAPPSDVSLDPLAEVSAGEIRVVRRRRGPRIAALAGVLAVVAAAGVLAATYGGITSLDNQAAAPLPAADPAEPVALAAADPPTIDATGRDIRVVSADQIPLFASETAALAPRAAADPAAGEAALSDQATVSGEAALSAEPPGRVIANPPLPRLRPATAGLPATPSFATNTAPQAFPTDPTTAVAGALSPGGDVDSALANVDRILMDQRAATGMTGSGDGEFYGPPVQPGSVQPGMPVAGEPLPYPVLEPLPPPPGAQQAYPVGPAYPQGEPYGPFYPGQQPYAVGSGYPVQPGYPPQQGYPVQPGYPGEPKLYDGVDLAAGEEQPPPWWLPKRRALVIPNAPVPPADIPQDQNPAGIW